MNDPWEGLVYYMEHLFGMQAETGVSTTSSPAASPTAPRPSASTTRCASRSWTCSPGPKKPARLAAISPWPTSSTSYWSNGRIIEATSATAPNAWRRYLYLMLDAYRAERAHPIPEPPMTYERLYDAMVHIQRGGVRAAGLLSGQPATSRRPGRRSPACWPETA